MLDPTQLARWRRDGYLAGVRVKTPVELVCMRARSLAIVDALDPTPWPDESQAQALEVPAGTLVVFDRRLPHVSGPNRSAQSRMAYALHAVDAAAAWSPLNWLQRRPGFPARGFA